MTQSGKGTEDPRYYLSYLLRLWQAGNAGRKVWRVSLESIQTRDRVSFASLQEQCGFLQQATTIDRGLALFRIRTRLEGTYQVCVMGMAKDGYAYDPNMNWETCKTIEVP